MGKDWLQWVTGRKGRVKIEDPPATSVGCMCAVFQLFDSNHLQFPLNQQQSSSVFDADDSFHHEGEDTIVTSKGLEAPRNSLELEIPSIEVGSMSLSKKREEILNFPVGINHIKTCHEKISSPRISTKSRIGSECCDSPGTKTPTLVARLMGLDLLPEPTSSPSSSSYSNPKPRRKHRNTLHTRSKTFSDDDISVGARSLPETPRVSSARRSDVEYHRLSLQINKENILNDQDLRRGSRFRQQDDSKSSPRHYVKHLVNQVKESVSRRSGLTDITNKISKLDELNNRRDENLVLKKPTKKSPKISTHSEITSTVTEPIVSPRVRFLEINQNKPLPTNSNTKSSKFSGKLQEVTPTLKGSKKLPSNLKKLPHQASDHAIRNKKEDLFAKKADKKMKKTPLMSSEILNISGPTLLPVKKVPSPPATKLPQKQVEMQSSNALPSKKSTQLSCTPSPPYIHQSDNKIFIIPVNRTTSNGCATTSYGGTPPEIKTYIQRIIRRTGITDKATPLSLAKWHTSRNPLDPSIFHYLELFNPIAAAGGGGFLTRRCNRKLIFELTDELLAEILRPHFEISPWLSKVAPVRNFPVAEELCRKISSFPAASCEVLEDIDALIDPDLCRLRSDRLIEEERERIVCEIEGEIFESLLRETAALLVARVITVVRGGRY